MKLRHEIKHELRLGDLYALRSRLPLLLRPDPHGDCGRYQIRSLYFDNLYDKALLEKINGLGITILFIEHVMSAVVNLCHRVVVMNEGHFLSQGEPTVVMRQPEVIKAYLGEDYENA